MFYEVAMTLFVTLDRDKLTGYNHYLMVKYGSFTLWKNRVMAGELSHCQLIADLYEYDKYTYDSDFDDYVDEYHTSTFKDIMLRVEDISRAIISLYED